VKARDNKPRKRGGVTSDFATPAASCGHQRAVLGEGKWQTLSKLQSCKVITICDHLSFLFGIEFEK
jgi:hypothetical protein